MTDLQVLLVGIGCALAFAGYFMLVDHVHR